jgi:hypothetical protein
MGFWQTSLPVDGSLSGYRDDHRSHSRSKSLPLNLDLNRHDSMGLWCPENLKAGVAVEVPY